MGSQECALCLHVFVHNKHIHIRVICASLTHEFFYVFFSSYPSDDEGEMTTNDVNARFVNGKPQSIESMIVMQSPAEWDRFMRFMERYAEANDLGFSKAG